MKERYPQKKELHDINKIIHCKKNTKEESLLNLLKVTWVTVVTV